MGSLAGHAISGVFLTLYGLALCFNFTWFHLKPKPRSGSTIPRSESPSFFTFAKTRDLSWKSWIPLPFTWIPIEPLCKIILCAIGIFTEEFLNYRVRNGKRQIVIEVYSIWVSANELNTMAKLHHIIMYGAFVLSGVIDLLVLIIRLPQQTSMLFLSLAFVVEGVQFSLHTMGRDALNIQVHSILTYAIFACAFFSVLRIFDATHVVINLGLSSCILLQGLWFIQAGFIMYGGFLDEKTAAEISVGGHPDLHRYLGLAGAIFSVDLILIAVWTVLVWIALSAYFNSRRRQMATKGCGQLKRPSRESRETCTELLDHDLTELITEQKH